MARIDPTAGAVATHGPQRPSRSGSSDRAQDDPDAAHRFLDAAREAADMLAELPKLGPAGRFRSRGLIRVRIWPIRGFDKILIVYSAERVGIDVLRVVHGARDLDALDLDDP